MVQLPDVPGVGPTSFADADLRGRKRNLSALHTLAIRLAPFAWDPYYGSRSLVASLLAQGADLNGFDLQSARGVSATG